MPKIYGRIRPYEIGRTKIKKKSTKIGSPDPHQFSILKHKFPMAAIELQPRRSREGKRYLLRSLNPMCKEDNLMTNSIALLATQSSEMTMTLKEITDMLKVRHDNAMRVVENMAESPDFGELLKLRSSYKNNFGATLPLNTYALNKRQSIAVAARLNTSLLMAIIDRWQELEDAQRAPAKPAYSLITATVQERLINEVSLAFEAMELYKQVEARLAIGDHCTWISFCNANSHISWLDRRNTTAFKLSLTVAKLYRRDFGKKTEKVGVEGTDTTPQVVYPTDWLMKAVVEAAAEYGRSTTLEIYRPEIARVQAPLAIATVNAFHEVQQLTNTQH